MKKQLNISGATLLETEARYQALKELNKLPAEALQHIARLSKEPKAVHYITHKPDALIGYLKFM